MSFKKDMSILLIEDDIEMCKVFEDYRSSRDDVFLVAKTNSSIEALELVKVNIPDAIIVDLELHDGYGTGLEFLVNLKSLKLSANPVIVVNTNIKSKNTYTIVHENFADFIFYKLQPNYSPKMVIDSLVLLRKNNETISSNDLIENIIEDRNKRLSVAINSELDKIGINHKLKGRDYIFDAIFCLLSEENEELNDYTIFQYLSKKYKLLTSSIGRAIQTAINEAWRTSAIEDLRDNYTAKINIHTGVPTPTEFIYYYVKKIKEYI